MSGADLQENWIYGLEMIFRRTGGGLEMIFRKTEEGVEDDFQENCRMSGGREMFCK